jgi:hypothetical protein
VSGSLLPLVRSSRKQACAAPPATPGRRGSQSRRPVHHSHIPRRNIGSFVARVHAQNVCLSGSAVDGSPADSPGILPLRICQCACITPVPSATASWEIVACLLNPMQMQYLEDQTGSFMRHWSPCYFICLANDSGHTQTVPTATVDAGERSCFTKHNRATLNIDID